jgi:hypothetical protein
MSILAAHANFDGSRDLKIMHWMVVGGTVRFDRVMWVELVVIVVDLPVGGGREDLIILRFHTIGHGSAVVLSRLQINQVLACRKISLLILMYVGHQMR